MVFVNLRKFPGNTEAFARFFGNFGENLRKKSEEKFDYLFRLPQTRGSVRLPLFHLKGRARSIHGANPQ